MALSIGEANIIPTSGLYPNNINNVNVHFNVNGNIPTTTTRFPLDENLSESIYFSQEDSKIQNFEQSESPRHHQPTSSPDSLKPYYHHQDQEQYQSTREEVEEKEVVGQVTVDEDSTSEMCGNDVQSLPPQKGDFPVEQETHGANELVIQPHSHLPKPEAPPGLVSNENGVVEGPIRSKSFSESLSMDVPSSIGKFFKERSNSLSASIAKRLSSLKEEIVISDQKTRAVNSGITEINISGINVVVRIKNDNELQQETLKGHISFFSRSNCRDCTAVRTFLRQRGLRFVEINVDVYPQREKELIQRTGTSQVPQIFFNEKLFGGLVALNSLRNSGTFDQRLKELLSDKCSGEAPSSPVYGFDDPDEEEPTDEMLAAVRLLRQKLPIQDRLMRMKLVKNCFAGNTMVDFLVHHLDCDRENAVEIGKQMASKHFIHHVFGENDFEDGNHFYRFLEHEPYIPKIFNFRGSTNDNEPKPADVVGRRLYKIMSAILEAYASDDRLHVDYPAISKSEEFRRYVNWAQELQRIDLMELSPNEKLAFFLNLYNAMAIHAVIRLGSPQGAIDRRSFYSDFQYIVGGYSYSLNTIKNGILRNNRRSPYSLVKPFGNGDKRLEVAVPKVNSLIHFGLCNGTRSSPVVRFFTPQGIEAELRYAAREFFQAGGVEVNLEKRTVYLTRIFKWFSVDFGQEKDILMWVIKFLDANKAGLLTHVLGDGGPINIVYQNFDWSVNF
ncbi:hypothetical protein K2173_006769 [Erythroxylum novogranatense]|uniref:DEP domain-containing protein n=1 Tax=Erythroxylum novogranatense TaxID=1862640 RepID=A0AAV8SYX2_9ROSI|nr:hypothetical protein K2173_006769 [Erythroxylum novogranatense]